MEKQPQFEDDRIRIWRAEKKDAPGLESDPTTLTIDAEREEPFESRVYALSELSLFGLVAQTVSADPTQDPVEVMAWLVDSDPTMRFVAKRERTSGRVTYVLVGTVGRSRTLLEREELVAPRVYRNAVRRFEDDMLKTWFVEEPAVIRLAQWREYDARAQGDGPAEGMGPRT